MRTWIWDTADASLPNSYQLAGGRAAQDIQQVTGRLYLWGAGYSAFDAGRHMGGVFSTAYKTTWPPWSTCHLPSV